MGKITIKIPKNLVNLLSKNLMKVIIFVLFGISIICFLVYLNNGLNVAYNDARSHLDIGRRVVEGLKTGLAQLGSVWLPLTHILMVPTIWNDFFWHSGLSGAMQSMISFVAVTILIYKYLEKLNVGLFGRLFAVLVFALNLNILYLQSTAMTELLLLATMTAGSYFLMVWYKERNLLDLLKTAFFIMLSTAIRYDGWFLFLISASIIFYTTLKNKGYKQAEGTFILFCTLGGVAIALWFLWNLLIFNDPFYFAFGPFSAKAQQAQIEAAGELFTKGNIFLSIKAYLYAVMYNTYTIPFLVSILGYVSFWRDKREDIDTKLSSIAIVSPFIFNVAALYFGHSVLFVVGVVHDTWFNVRYGMMLVPAIVIFMGYWVDKLKNFRWVIVTLTGFVLFFAFVNKDIVTLDDALIGASGKNVVEVSNWLKDNASDKKGFILISVASHDAIIFSSDLPMKKFIHEGTGKYWENAIEEPDKWARWIVMRTNDMSDWTFREVYDAPGLEKFELVDHYPFADIYQLKDEYVDDLITEPILKQ